MSAARRLLTAAVLLCGTAGCYFASDPVYDTVTTPAAGYDIFPGTTTAVVFVANQTSGPHAATEAHSLDETIVKVIPTTLTRSATGEGLDNDPGKVFLIYGVSAGQADIHVFRDGEDVGTVPVVVISQDRS